MVYTDPPVLPGEGEGSATPARTRVQVRVDTKVRDVEHGQAKPTGQFNYTFTVDKDIKVMPRTYSEFMMYLDARRRAKAVVESMKSGFTDNGVRERLTE